MAFEFEHVAPAPVSPLATEHMVRMRDGVRLATDVYLREGLGDASLTLVQRAGRHVRGLLLRLHAVVLRPAASPALRATCPRVTSADVIDLPQPGTDEVRQ